MRNLKLLMLLLLLVAGISFAGGRSNRRTREKIGNTGNKINDVKPREKCWNEESKMWYKCN